MTCFGQKTYPLQEEAFVEFNRQPQGRCIIARDKYNPSSPGCKAYHVLEYEQLFTWIMSLPIEMRVGYELLVQNRPSQVYFDLDADMVAENVDKIAFVRNNFHLDFSAFWRELVKDSSRVQVCSKHLAGEDRPIEDLASSCIMYHTVREEKFSWHVVFPEIILRNNFECGALRRQFERWVITKYGSDGEKNSYYVNVEDNIRVMILDGGVYTKNRVFRLCENAKLRRPFDPTKDLCKHYRCHSFVVNDELKERVISPDNVKEHFYESLIQYIPHISYKDIFTVSEPSSSSSSPARSHVTNEDITSAEKATLGLKLTRADLYNSTDSSHSNSSSYSSSSSSSSGVYGRRDIKAQILFTKLFPRCIPSKYFEQAEEIRPMITDLFNDLSSLIFTEGQRRIVCGNPTEARYQKDVIRSGLLTAAKDFLSHRGSSPWFGRQPPAYHDAQMFERHTQGEVGSFFLFCGNNKYCMYKNGYHRSNNIYFKINALPELLQPHLFQYCHSVSHPRSARIPTPLPCVTEGSPRTQQLYDALCARMRKYLIEYNEIGCPKIYYASKEYSAWRLLKCLDLIIQLFCVFIMLKERLFRHMRDADDVLDVFYKHLTFWTECEEMYMIMTDSIMAMALDSPRMRNYYAYFRSLMVFQVLYQNWHASNAFLLKAQPFSKLFSQYLRDGPRSDIHSANDAPNNSVYTTLQICNELELKIRNFTLKKRKKQSAADKHLTPATVTTYLGERLRGAHLFQHMFATWH